MLRHLRSLRDYLTALREIDDLQPVDVEVDWNLEIGAITRRAYELPAAAPLFNVIKGIEPGFRVLGAPAGLSSHPEYPLARIALSLGLPIDTSASDIVTAWSRLQECEPLAPREVSTGPCKQNRMVGDDVDLFRLPAPLLHAGDGGRYLNTYGTVITRSPDGSWTNWAITRIMLRNRTSMTGIVVPAQHVGRMHRMWSERGEDMPFALALGTSPAVAMVAGCPVRDGLNEAALLGGWFGEPVEVVRCESHDLMVPTTSEIVVEGFLSFEDVAPEGPMGEYSGLLWPEDSRLCPVYRVTAVTYRDEPVLPVVVAGMPVEENHTNWGINIAAAVLHEVRAEHLPVRRAFMPFAAACHWLVVTVDTAHGPGRWGTWRNLATEVGRAAYRARPRHIVPKVIVVEDDVDPADITQVVWAVATRAHPNETIVVPDMPTLPLVGYLSEKERRNARTDKVVFDCLPRDDWSATGRPVRANFAQFPAELRRQVLDRWSEYGYPAKE
ncbi:UbiD family decarboxylase [Streptomyces collinus]|uniref:UbiD family decarboxylase n=1 Tax=Streptomyces collinus TaxID=42684 RepID=UPI0036C9C872